MLSARHSCKLLTLSTGIATLVGSALLLDSSDLAAKPSLAQGSELPITASVSIMLPRAAGLIREPSLNLSDSGRLTESGRVMSRHLEEETRVDDNITQDPVAPAGSGEDSGLVGAGAQASILLL